MLIVLAIFVPLQTIRISQNGKLFSNRKQKSFPKRKTFRSIESRKPVKKRKHNTRNNL